jgi:hypothetical protein
MKKIVLIIRLSLFFIVTLTINLNAQQKLFEKHFAIEAGIGPRIPLGITTDDVTTGLGIQLNLGYRLTKYLELFNLSIDFGNSSPHNPNMQVIGSYYDYYGTLAMETVTVIGLPLTMRIHFPVKKNVTGFIGAGGAYYWFSSRFEAPGYYGGVIQLRERRNRDGLGPIFESGLITDFLSDRWLVMLKGQYSMLETSGKSLSIQEEIDPDAKVSRTDKYLMVTIGIHYLF